jgi:hypothetical protein
MNNHEISAEQISASSVDATIRGINAKSQDAPGEPRPWFLAQIYRVVAAR